MRCGWSFVDEEDARDKFLIRILGFTIFGIYADRLGGYFNIQILGAWIQFDIGTISKGGILE